MSMLETTIHKKNYISGSFHHRNVQAVDFHGVDGRRKKDIVLAKINLTIVIIFIIAHLGRWIPSIFVLVWVRINLWFKVFTTNELRSIFSSLLGFKSNAQHIYWPKIPYYCRALMRKTGSSGMVGSRLPSDYPDYSWYSTAPLIFWYISWKTEYIELVCDYIDCSNSTAWVLFC